MVACVSIEELTLDISASLMSKAVGEIQDTVSRLSSCTAAFSLDPVNGNLTVA